MITLILFSFLSFEASCDKMKLVRSAYHEIRTERHLKQFIKLLKKVDCKEAQPYFASAIMQQAKYTILPTSKLKYFNRGKILLEKFIQENPNNIEASYIRVLIQSNAPNYLGYNKNRKADIAFIKSNISKSTLPADYQKLILTTISSL